MSSSRSSPFHRYLGLDVRSTREKLLAAMPQKVARRSWSKSVVPSGFPFLSSGLFSKPVVNGSRVPSSEGPQIDKWQMTLASMLQQFEVIKPFTALAPISGAERRFAAGEISFATAQSGTTLILTLFTDYFLVERSVFEACCKWGNPGA
jgi:hypothetical protein